jgi:hypothetical protein
MNTFLKDHDEDEILSNQVLKVSKKNKYPVIRKLEDKEDGQGTSSSEENQGSSSTEQNQSTLKKKDGSQTLQDDGDGDDEVQFTGNQGQQSRSPTTGILYVLIKFR